MAANLTYSTLLADIQNYAERTDATFVAQLPRLVNQAENRIASEARGLGFMRAITDDLVPFRQWAQKPARWRETVSLQIGTGATYKRRKMLFQRTYEFCREYWPDPTQADEPKFYGDWDYSHWVIVPTPAFAYPYEVVYHERPTPLSESEQTNWTTQFAPQLLIYACLLEAQPFLKRDDRMEVFTTEYNRALAQVEYDQKRRLFDRSHQEAEA